MKSTIYKIFIGILTLQLLACGYLSDEPRNNEVYDIKDIRSSCELNTEELNRIFSDDVSQQINCLEENFNQFVRYVRRNRSDVVDQQDLTTFVNRFFTINRDHFLRGLRFLFEINMLLLNDRRESISTDNIRPLFRIILNTNKHAIELTKLLEKTNEETFYSHRDQLILHFQKLSSSILEVADTGESSDTSSKINIKKFISNLNEKFPELQVDMTVVESFLFMKKLFLGGNKFELNNSEVKILLKKSPELFEIALDLFYMTEKSFNDHYQGKRNIYDKYKDVVIKIKSLLHPLNDQTLLFNVDRFVDALTNVGVIPKGNDFIDSLMTREKLRKIVKSFKVNILNSNPENFTFKELKISLTFLELSTLSIPHFLAIKDLYKQLADAEIDKKNRLINAIESEIEEASIKILEVLSKNPDFPAEQNLLGFLIDFNKLLDDDIQLPEKVLSSAFSVKTLFLGGNKKSVTTKQLQDFVKKLPKMAVHILNIIHIQDEEIKEDHQKYSFFMERLRSILSFIYKPKRDEVVFKRSDLIEIADYLSEGKEFNIHSYLPSIDAIKVKILKGSKELYTTFEITNFLNLFLEGFETALYFDLNYKELNSIFSRPTRISYLPVTNISELETIPETRRRELRKVFVHHAKTFRYFRGENGVAFYGPQIKRNRKGFVEASLINYAFTILQQSYGVRDSNGVLTADFEVLKRMLLDFKAILQELGLWTYNFQNFVRNILLLSDLFQSTSNGTMRMELDETSEFGVLVLQTMTLSKEIIDELKKVEDIGIADDDGIDCSYTLDENLSPAFPVPCHRHYFFKLFFEKLNHKKDFPKFYQFYKKSSPEELNSFLSDIEGFARDFNDPKTPMAKRDYGLVLGSLLNIESTFIRFDKNNDNVLDNKELDEAFAIYRDAIIAVAELDEGQKKYAKSIFLYMVKYQKIPSKWEVVNFHYNPFADTDVEAKRIHIGTLLYYLVKK